MCAASSPDPSGSSQSNSYYREAEPQPPAPAESADLRLLEEILNPSTGRQSAPIDQAAWERLREVGRRYQNQVLTQSPIVDELIAAVLDASLTKAAGARAADMNRHIAETLWNDPPSHARLNALWNTLQAPPRPA